MTSMSSGVNHNALPEKRVDKIYKIQGKDPTPAFRQGVKILFNGYALPLPP
jgi:hypothetical protein